MMRALYVPVDEEVLQKLGQLARAEKRHPKDTASILLERAIREADAESERVSIGTYPVSE